MGLGSRLAVTALLAIFGASSAYAQQAPAEVEKNQKAVKGTWKTAAGSCDAAYFKTAEDNKTVRPRIPVPKTQLFYKMESIDPDE